MAGEGVPVEKTVIYQFPDNFKFPQYYGQKNTVRAIKCWSVEEMRPWSACYDCPLQTGDDDGSWCSLTGDDGETGPDPMYECPFYRGQDTARW